MTEADLKRELCGLIRRSRPRYTILRLEEMFTHGVPDISIDGNKFHSWWEVKLVNKTRNVKSKGIQKLTCQKLDIGGFCRYIVYWVGADFTRTYIVHPNDIDEDPSTWVDFTDGFNHDWILERVLEVHNDHQR